MRFLLIALLFALGPAQLLAQEAGVAVRQTEVKKEPFSDAETVETLSEQAQVQILKRQGGWLQVRSGAATGWVRMLAIRVGAGQSRSGDSGIKSLFNVARTGASGSTVSTGVRGLDKEQIRNASPNPAELAKLSGYAASRADAEHFASTGPELKHQTIEYLAH